MDAFETLEADDHRIKKQLAEFIGSYDEMSMEQRLGRASLLFGEIKKHFEREESILASTACNNQANKAFTEECLADRKDIVDAMDNLLMSHVDDFDFNNGLRKLLARFNEHLKHYAHDIPVEIREQLSAQELNAVNATSTDSSQSAM